MRTSLLWLDPERRVSLIACNALDSELRCGSLGLSAGRPVFMQGNSEVCKLSK